MCNNNHISHFQLSNLSAIGAIRDLKKIVIELHINLKPAIMFFNNQVNKVTLQYSSLILIKTLQLTLFYYL